jgi:hypothetical protein
MRRRDPRRSLALAGLGILFAGVGLLLALGLARHSRHAKTYALAATRACLSKTAKIEDVPPGQGQWSFPGFYVDFAGDSFDDPPALYFAPTVGEAKSKDTPDSDRMQRRRNVLVTVPAYLPWDRRIVRCLSLDSA